MVEADDTSDASTADYINNAWDGILPSATGTTAKEFEKETTADQTTLASAIHGFLINPDSPLTQLNAEQRRFTVMINIPQSNLIKIIYGLSLGTSCIGETAPNDNKILALTGEGNSQIGCPQALILPNTIRTKIQPKCPTDEEVQQALQTDTTNWYRFRTGNIPDNQTAEIMQCSPIPPFLVYDGFEQDIRAEVIYERVLSLDTQDLPMIQHCRNFLRACMVQRNIPDPKPHISATTFMTTVNIAARQWAISKFKAMLPEIANNAQTAQTNTTAAISTSTLEQLIRSISTEKTAATTEATTTSKPEEKFGMSDTELQTTLAMCGLNNGEEELLPSWFEKLNEKGQNDNTRNQVIIKTLQNILFEEAEIPITAPLLLMIRKRKWLSDDPTATYRTAAKGLSVFAVGAMTEDEVAIINDTMEALEQATTTTAKEYKDVTRIKATVPSEAHEFVLQLKTFANLLYALFGSLCPLYTQVRTMIRAFNTYTKASLKAITMQTKASILWILLLQTRHFAGGNLTTLAEFRNMMDKITAKDCNITHAEVPAAFITSSDSKKRKIGDVDTPTTPTRERPNPYGPPVTPSPERPTRVHPLLREKVINNILRTNPNIPIRKICTYCSTDISKLSKDPSKCVLGMLGICRNRFCKRRHLVANDMEAKHIIQLLEKAINDPEKMKKDLTQEEG
jgi:hypothetical protein